MQIERKKKPVFIQPIVLAGMECEQESIQLPTQEFINKLIESHSPQEFFVPMVTYNTNQRFGAQYHARDADGFFIPNPKQIPSQKQQQNQSFQGAEQKLQLQDMQRLEQIGQGVSGVVQRAIHVPTNRMVALKVMIYLNQNIQIVNDETFTKQVMLELQTLVSCNHENILSCYGAFIEGSQITIAMEYMNVGTLQDVLRKQGRIPEVMLGQIAYQLLRGLDYLHRTKKIIHRDIKPSNILLNSEGLIKISDFGVSGQLLNTKDQRDTWIGTVSYMSPERFRGESYSADTDVWSLGICLLECAYGHFPYLDKNTTFWEMMEAINSKPTPQCPPDDYSLEMNDFIQKCLRKEKGTRPSALELLNLPIIKQYEGVSLTYLKNWLNIS